jgi:hypothetical protein
MYDQQMIWAGRFEEGSHANAQLDARISYLWYYPSSGAVIVSFAKDLLQRNKV